MKNPLISICIPTYNSSKYIRPCLESILNQTFSDFEVIISDDGSSDDTLEIISEYAQKDNRIKIFFNQRVLKNVNKCMELARGEWIKFVFHDDIIYPKCLEKMVENIIPSVPIICCLRNFILEEGTDDKLRNFFEAKILTIDKLFPNITEPVILKPETLSPLVIKHFGANFIGEASNVMIHKNVCPKFGYWRTDLPILGDLEFWLRISSNTGIIYIPEKLASFRVHATSKTSQLKNESIFKKQELELLKLFYQFCFTPHYAFFRQIIKEADPSFDFISTFSWRTREAYRCAKNNKEDMVLLNEFNNKNPIIEQFSKRIVIYSHLLKKISKFFKGK